MKNKGIKNRAICLICSLVILLSSAAVAPLTVNSVTDTKAYTESDVKSWPVEANSGKIHWKLTKKGVLTVTKKDGVEGLVEIRDCGSTANGDHIPWYKLRNLISEIKIGKNIKRIGNYAFYGLKNAVSIQIGKDVSEIGTAPFSRCDGVKVYSVSSENEYYYAPDSGILYNSDKTLLVAYPANKQTNDSTYTLPSSVKEIKGSAFAYNQNLQYFKMAGKNLTTINDRAFMGAKSLKTITIENGCTYIGKRAFYNIPTLTDITLPPSISSIGNEILTIGTEYKPVLKVHCAKQSYIFSQLDGKGYSMKNKNYLFTISFDAGEDAEIDEKKTSVYYGDAYELPEPELDGYEFIGWYKTKNFKDSELVTEKTKMLTAKNHTLYAKYKGMKYILELDACGGVCNRNTLEVTFNELYGALPVSSKYGYEFLGWFTTEEDDENEIGEQIRENSVFKDEEIDVLYARYRRTNFDVTLDADGGICSVKKINVTIGKPYGELPVPKKTGYTFIGWVNEDDDEITSDTIVEDDTYDTLYAIYDEKDIPDDEEFTVKLNAGKGICSIRSMTFFYGEEYGSLPTPYRKGYDFVGWFTEDDEQIYSDDIFEDETLSVLYAKYKKIAVGAVKGMKIAYNTKSSVKLSWSKVNNATGYEVYKKTNDGAYKLFKTVTGTSTTAKLNANKSYKFRIRAFVINNDYSKTFGEYGTEVSRGKTNIGKPSLKAKYNSSTGMLNVKWKALKNAKKYQVYQYKSKKWKELKISSNAFTVQTSKGKTYKFRVRGYKTVLGHKYYGKYVKITKRT